MKKKIISIIMSIIIAVGCFALTSCNWNREKTDGEFIYVYKNFSDIGKCYSITGSTEEGKKYKENVYVPTHFNGLPVYYTFTSSAGFTGAGMSTHTMQVNCKNLYFNYIQKYDFIFGGRAEYLFIPEATESMSRHIFTHVQFTTARIAYVGKLTYAYMKETALSSQKADSFVEANGYILSHYDYGSRQYSIIAANTSYMFNYEDSPNNDYFFINNFESESLIENTPYDPIREGYTFGGWYKEPECIHKWNFATDKLPEAEYDENGYVVDFVETKLYAKWIKE